MYCISSWAVREFAHSSVAAHTFTFSSGDEAVGDINHVTVMSISHFTKTAFEPFSLVRKTVIHPLHSPSPQLL